MMQAPKLRELGDEPLRPDRPRVERARTVAAKQAPGRFSGRQIDVVRSLWWDATRCSGRHIASYISRHQLENLNE